eukprot:Partr_v1_DN28660_c1_g1_i2_m49378 putative structural maintenance of chromosomes protein
MTIEIPDAESEPTPRLVMDRMVLENFKSYAGRVEIGPFHSSFTSIVGANGSGKSNVIDALLFVFGFKAKKMRQEKLSGLIHHSGAFQNLSYCQVEIHFKEVIDDFASKSTVDVPGSAMVVSRRATKDKSQYFVDGQSRTYAEVTTMLKGKGIDLDHKRFLILQGEVESIAQMKPKGATDSEEGLLEYLEDIIGTSQYKDPINAALESMEALNVVRDEKLNRIKIAESDVKALESQKVEAENYLEDENKLVKLKNKFYQFCIWDSKDRLAELKDEASKASSNLEEHVRLIGEQSSLLKHAQKEFDSLNKDYQAVKSEAGFGDKQAAKFERDFIQLEEKRKHLKARIKKSEKQIEKDRLGKSESDVWVRNHSGDLDKKKASLVLYLESFAKAELELGEIRQQLNGKTDKYQVAIDAKKAELVPWAEKINSKNSEINIKESELQLLRERLDGDDKKARDTKAMLEQSELSLKDKKKTLKTVAFEKNRVDSAIAGKRKEELSLKEQESSLRTAVVDLSQQVELSKSSAQAMSSRSELVKVLYHQRDTGKIPGIIGSLSDLGSIDDKYDVAISSAYAERLKWIVVDTVQTAEKCLKVLKEKSAGRASFIVMERVADLPAKKKTPENALRMIDLIKPGRPEYLKAFYYVVKETLIADDLDQANRLAFGAERWKVVTLDGNVIDKAGTMSGGGSKKVRGAFNKHAAPAESGPIDINAMDKLRSQRETELKECRFELATLTKEISNLLNEQNALENQSIELEAEVASLEKQTAALKSSISSSSKKVSGPSKHDLKVIADLEASIAKFKEEELHLKAETSSIQGEITALQNKILEVGGDRLRRQNARVKDMQDEIDLLQESIAHIEGQLKSTEKTQQKANGTISKAEKEIEAATEELKEVETEIAEKEDAKAAFAKKLAEASKFLESREEALNALKDDCDKKLTEFNRLRSEKIDAENLAGDVSKRHLELSKRVETWHGLLKKLKLQTINDMSSDTADLKLEVFNHEDLVTVKKDHIVREITVLEAKLSEAQPNIAILQEYRERYTEYMSRVRDLDLVTVERDAKKSTYEDLRKKRFEEFMRGFTIISQKLKEMYQMITLGGNAELELVDSLDPFSEGIMFSVMPPKKSWKSISNLSGGEKTLSSLALVFALHHFKPTPLYVMDEIDAALDFRNVSIIANYISERTKNAQFVIISLRNNMFELADRLVGIYKTQNTTKSIAINPAQIAINTQ